MMNEIVKGRERESMKRDKVHFMIVVESIKESD